MLVVRGGTHNKQQQLGDGADGDNNSNNTQTYEQTQQRALRTLQDNHNRSLLVSCAGRRTVYRFGGIGEGGVRVWWALSGESVLYSQWRFRGLFNCGAGRRGREDVGGLTGGAVELCAGALRLCYVLVVLGGVGVLRGRIVCFSGAGVVRWCSCSVCVLGECLEAGVRTIWCWVVLSFFGVLADVGGGVSRFYFLFLGEAVSMLRMLPVRLFCLHRRSVDATLCESLG